MVVLEMKRRQLLHQQQHQQLERLIMDNITSNNNANFYWWFGVVEDRDDPLRLGRCRTRILGYHTDDKEELPTEDLPWAIPVMPANSAGSSGVGWSPTGAVEGSWVVGFFADGENGQHPMFFGTVGSIPGGLASTGCGDGSNGSGQPGDSATGDGTGSYDGAGIPASVGNLTPTQANQEAINTVKFFMSKGWKKAHACAIVGNLQQECGNFNPNVIIGKKRGDSGNAAGVAQWNRKGSPDRVRNFKTFTGIDLFNPGNIEWRSFLRKQLEFIHWELTTKGSGNSESKSGDKLRKYPDTKEGASGGAAMIDKFYERSDGHSRNERSANAINLFNKVN